MEYKMKLHLEKMIGNYRGLACTNNSFVKGGTLNKEEFMQAIKDGKNVCIKCSYILARKLNQIK